MAELTEWQLYEAIEPFGDRRGDIQAGMLASVLANIHRTKETRPFSPADFIPEWNLPTRGSKNPQTPEHERQLMLILQIEQNARIKAGLA